MQKKHDEMRISNLSLEDEERELRRQRRLRRRSDIQQIVPKNQLHEGVGILSVERFVLIINFSRYPLRVQDRLHQQSKKRLF